MICSDNQQGIWMRFGEVHTNFDSLIKSNSLPNLPAGIGRMILLINRSPFNLQEEAFIAPLAQQTNGFFRHLSQGWLIRGTLILLASLWATAGKWSCKRASPLQSHISRIEKTKYMLSFDCIQASRIGDYLIALGQSRSN